MSASQPEPAPADLQAVLFDMDGLIVDSEPQWFNAESSTVAELGGSWGKRQQLDLLGSNLEVAADYMIAYTGTSRTRADVMTLLTHHMSTELRRSVTFQPGAVQLLAELASTHIALGLVTSSVREHVDAVLRHLPDQVFDVLVTADDVTLLKPHPLPYLTAVELLGVQAHRTVVLEDSPAGVAAAEAAGCYVVAVPSVVTIAPAANRTVVPSLTGLDLTTLQSLVAPANTR